jgi:hypothetical protein
MKKSNLFFFSYIRSLLKEIVVYFIYQKHLWKIKVYLHVRLQMQLDHQIAQLVLSLNHDHNFNTKKEQYILINFAFFSHVFFPILHICNALLYHVKLFSFFFWFLSLFLHAYIICHRPLNNALF